MPGFIYRTKKDRITLVKEEKVDESRPLSQFLTDYIVVGPISTTLQGATGQCKVIVTSLVKEGI